MNKKNEEDIKSKVGEYIHPSEYAQRHIATLKNFHEWDPAHTQLQLKHNRILQNEFLTRPAISVLADARNCKIEWLTDVVCPSVQSAFMLHAAKELVVNYQVDEEDINSKVHEIFKHLKETDVANQIDKAMQSKQVQATIEKEALIRFQKIYPNNNLYAKESKDILDAFGRIQEDIERKKITHLIVGEYLKERMPKIEEAMKLVKKETLAKGQNVDYVYLGAPGSGKSTLLRHDLTSQKKKNMVIVATDNYRGVSSPGMETHESVETDQVYIKTQDTAYLIKELVQIALKEKVEAEHGQRPNILFDGVTFERGTQQLLASNKKTHSVFAALPDISLVPKRAHARALNAEAGADRGRQVHTTHLLKGHANSSQNLLQSIPEGIETMVYNTNVPMGEMPKSIAKINTKKGGTIDIYDLQKMSLYLGKAMVNVDATSKPYLYLDPTKKKYQFTYDNAYQANEFLNMIKLGRKEYNDVLRYPVNLQVIDGEPFATFTADDKGIVKLDVKSKDEFDRALKNDLVLKEVVIQVAYGSLEKARKMKFQYGLKNTLNTALNKLGIVETTKQLVFQYNQTPSVSMEPTHSKGHNKPSPR